MLVGKFDNSDERVFIILQQNRHLVPQDEVLCPRCETTNVLNWCVEELFELVSGVDILLANIQVFME